MNLILFTAAYPYITGAEQNFVEAELPYLAEKFEQIFLVPQVHNDAQVPLPNEKVKVINQYAALFAGLKKMQIFARGVFSLLTYIEILQKPLILLKPAYLKRLIFFAGNASIASTWVKNWIKTNSLQTSPILFYTYWFDHVSTGIALAKRDFPKIKLISRAHGYDIYEERHQPPYWPLRNFTLKNMELLFPDSLAGAQYLKNKYPQFTERIETARLGIMEQDVVSKPSSDGVLRIASCSRMVPVKRLDLLLKAIHILAEYNPHQKIHWCHFGNGEMRHILENMAQNLPSNAAVEFPGYTTQLQLFDYYKNNPVDVFVNVSQSEGTPVAVMEAISCSIPIIATAVGGNTEIVTTQNGILLSENPSPAEIADALQSVLNHAMDDKRQGGRQLWQEYYNAHKNYTNFVERLTEIISK